ncbi:TPA: hypothetical protein QHO67_002363 [Escherichia coli]|nr:hypothetical protein [Escherichia coli]
MSHFKDLCRINQDVEEKRIEAAQILRDEAARLIAFYEEWLDLPSLYWENEDGELKPYVETGLPRQHTKDFHTCSVDQIPVSSDNIFRMTVRTWIESSFDADAHPVGVVIALELHSVSEDRTTIKVSVEDDISVRVNIAAPEDRKWAEVTKSMKRHIAARLKKRAPFALR